MKLIAGGTVVNATGALEADVVIDGEQIAAVLAPNSELTAALTSGNADIIDGRGHYVVPGGVDVHVHLQLPMSPEATSSDSFETGTIAAAWGGTTTLIDFAGQIHGSSVHDAIEERLGEADGQCAIDYGLHLSMGDVHEQSLEDMHTAINDGITSFKLFMAYPGAWYSDDGQILRAMQVASEQGALVMMHAENGIAIDVLRDQAVARGQTGSVWHGRTRPAALEGEASHRAIQLATVAGAPLYIVHLSAADALEQVVWARDRGQNVFAETCPQYLYLSLEEHLDQEGQAGVRHICSPPLRARSDGHQDTLWTGLRTDDLSVVSTDHCPFCDAEKRLGIDDFRQTPNGLGAIEHRMDLLHQGVVQGELSLPRWVDVCATTPARLFGLQGRKGVIAPGADADVVLYDPSITHTLGATDHHMNIDYSVWEGTTVTGQAQTVISRGEYVIKDRTFVGRSGHGQYLKRAIPEPLR
ncbi:MAG: dihydropyrimidinase [Actinomycetia bacterium]|nr:dihydropyrimidinase [Actinomycetes bacterium]